MPRIQEYNASGEFHASDKGIAAYDTMGRRVAGQYDAAASDMTQAGRVTAQSQLMIGRWPFNIIKLQNNQAARAAQRDTAAAKGGGGVNIRAARSGPSITDDQFAPRRMPNLAALNEVSEGMGSLGSYLGRGAQQDTQNYDRYGYRPAGSQYGNLADLAARRGLDDARYNAQREAEQRRQDQLNAAAYEKSWNKYEKQLDQYNQEVRGEAQKASPYGTYQNSNDPNSPYTGYGGVADRPVTSGEMPDGYKSSDPMPEGANYGGPASSSWTTFAMPTFAVPSSSGWDTATVGTEGW